MGVEDDFTGIAATTFSLMRARMVAHEADSLLFEATLAKAVRAGIFKGPLTAIIDSSPVHGAGNVADTYELIRKMMGRLARAMGEHLEAGSRTEALGLAATKPDIDWQDPGCPPGSSGRAGRAGGRAARQSRDERGGERVRGGRSGCVVGPGRPPGRRPRRGRAGDPRGVAPDRVISHSDPEMRHGRKSASRRFDGHKLDVMIDEDTELVLGVDVRAGNAGDGEGAAPLLKDVQETEGIEIETLLGDMAYSDGDVREAVEEDGTELVAKVPPVTNGGRFPKVCASCPLRDRCTKRSGGRIIEINDDEELLIAARQARWTPQFRQRYKQRARVERKNAQLKSRRAKLPWRGLRKANAWLKLRMAALNLDNLGRAAVLAASSPLHHHAQTLSQSQPPHPRPKPDRAATATPVTPPGSTRPHCRPLN